MLIGALALAGCSTKTHERDVLYSNDAYTLYYDSLTTADGSVCRALSSMHITSLRTPPSGGKPIVADWAVSDIPTAYPRLTLGMKLPDALYNMAIDHAAADTAGALTPRAITLAMAWIAPERSMAALRALTKNGRITSPHTTAWPIDVSRVEWILAAAEVYYATGDEAWAREMYEIGHLSLADDNHVNYNSKYSLYSGSMVPLRVADSYYPEWMSATDIFSSMSLTANVLYSRAYNEMAEIGERLGENVTSYRDIARNLSDAINLNFWIPDRGCYSQMLYGTFPIAAPVTDNLGQALAVDYDVCIPEMRRRLMEKTPVAPYGTPLLWPSMAYATEGVANAVDACTQAYWCQAAAIDANAPMLSASMAALMASAALAADEVAATDPFTGRPVELPDSLYPNRRAEAAAARLAMYLRTLFGISIDATGMRISPVVPAEYALDKIISGLHYREAELTIAIHGTGNRIARFTIDGVGQNMPVVPPDLTGRHVVDITMASNSLEHAELRRVEAPELLPAIPTPSLDALTFTLSGAKGKEGYEVWRDGVFEQTIDQPRYTLFNPGTPGVYAFAVTDPKSQLTGYTCRQWLHLPGEAELIARADSFATAGTHLMTDSLMAPRMVETSAIHLSHLGLEVEAPAEGRYLVDLCYANGAGPIYTQLSCGMRTLLVNGSRVGVFVLPQLGLGDWNATAFSNTLTTTLQQGINTLSVDYVVPYNINSASSDNLILIAYLRLRRIE